MNALGKIHQLYCTSTVAMRVWYASGVAVSRGGIKGTSSSNRVATINDVAKISSYPRMKDQRQHV